MSEFIYHITSRVDWEVAQRKGKYEADSLVGQGFIHCSKSGQILRVANTMYSGLHGLVLLAVDPAELKSPLRWEPGQDLTTEVFPHVYGPLNLDAIYKVVDFEPKPDGTFTLPENLGKIES
jgi:uncharacterized protein (DUF952 family)